MIRRELLVFLSFLFLILSLLFFTGQQDVSTHIDAVVRVERVIDGDTFWAYSLYGFKEGQSFKVRLADVDAPERDENGFSDALSELNVVLTSAPCVLLDVSDPPYDRYGRVVAVVYVPLEGVLMNVNTYLYEQGLVRYVDYSDSFHPESFEKVIPAGERYRAVLDTYCS